MPGPPAKLICGVVVSAGKMMKAVKVRTAKQTYHRFFKKHFQSCQNYLVSDPNSSLRTGDVVRIAAERKVSRHIRHVVTEIVAPWGPGGVEERPPLLSEEERWRRVREKTERKKERRRERKGEGKGEGGGRGKEKEKEGEGEGEGEGRESEEDKVEGMVEGTAVAS